MTDGYLCDGCRARETPETEQWHTGEPFVTVSANIEKLRVLDITLDDLPTPLYSLTHTSQEDAGDYCPDCGREIIEQLVAMFQEDADR